jgi:autotransporter-associated beta strand protein
MKTRHLFAARSVPAAATFGLLISVMVTGWAADFYWSGNGSTLGGTGTWDTTSSTNWATVATGPFSTTWVNANNDTAIFGGTVGRVTLGDNITVGGLQFNTTGYLLNIGANTLTFGAATNVIRLNYIASATISNQVSGSGNLTLAAANPVTAGTVVFTGRSTGGWSGTTTIGQGMTLQTVSAASFTNRVLANTTGININGGTLRFDRAGNANLDAINDTAPITVNGGGTFAVNSVDAGGASAIENVGTVTIYSGQFNLNWINNPSSGGTITLANLIRSNSTVAVTFSRGANSQFVVTGAGTTPAGQIIGPWATIGGVNGIGAQTDYAVYAGSVVTNAAIAASTEDTWTTAANAYTVTNGTTLTATRTITALRAIGTGQTNNLGGFSLETYGLLSGGTGGLIVTNGTLTTPSGGGNLFLTAGNNAITIAGGAVIADNGGTVTLVKSGSGTVTNRGINTYTGGTVINAGVLVYTADTAMGASGSRHVTFNGAGTLIWGFDGSSLGTLTLNPGAAGTLGSLNSISFTTTTGSGTIRASGGQAKTVSLGDASAFTGDIALAYNANNYNAGVPHIQFTKLNDAVGSSIQFFRIGGGTDSGQGGTIALTGDVGSLTFNNRQIQLLPKTGGSGQNMFHITLMNNNATATNIWVINTSLLNNYDRDFNFWLRGSNAGNNEFAGAIGDSTYGGPFSTGSGILSLVKDDSGTWILSGTNTYSGRTSVNAGMLVFANTSAKSPSTTVTATLNTASIGLGVGGAGYYTSADLDNLFANTLTGFALTNAAMGVGIYTAVGDFTYASNITGSRPLTKLGADRLILSGTNTYSGTTKIEEGVLEAHPGSGFSTNSYLQLDGGVLQSSGLFVRTNNTTVNKVNFQWSSNDGGGFAAKGGKLTVRIGNTARPTQIWTNAALANGIRGTLKFGSASADSEVEFVNHINLNGVNRTIDVAAGTGGDFATISGNISNLTGTAGITKTGAGVLKLTGANTYNGNTTVSGGTLIYDGSLSAGAAVVIVHSNATLGGSGNIQRAVTVNSGGTLAPGNSPGTLVVSDLTLQTGANLALELDSTSSHDQVRVNGSTVSVGGANLVLTWAATPNVSDTFLIIDNQTAGLVSGEFAGWAHLSTQTVSGVAFQIDYQAGDGNDVLLTTVLIPEPGTLVLVGSGLALLGVLRRRRK